MLKRDLVVFALAFLISLLFMAYWQGIVSQSSARLGFDVYPRWVAIRAFWHGQTPYSSQVTEQADLIVYGRPRLESEVPFGFYEPAIAAVVLSPLVLLPYEWAGIVWSALSFAILTTLFILWSWQLDPRPKPWLWGLIVAGGFFYRPALMAILNGQHSIFLVGCAMLAWGLIVRKFDVMAGIVLAIAIIKPSVFLLMPMVILLWALRWRRWSIILGFAGTLTVCVAITFIQIGWWVSDYLALLGLYEQVQNSTIGLAWSMSSVATPFGLLWLGQGLIVLFIGLGRLWHLEDFPWLASIAAINLNLIFTPHIIEYDMGILIIPLLWLGAEWSSRRWGMSAWLLLIWFPWLSWVLVFAVMGTAGMWQQVMWLGYTNLLLLAVLVWLRIKNGLIWYGVTR